MERPSWAPDEVDLDRPSVARVYDYYLGGSHNFAADRAFAEQVLRLMPEVRLSAQHNRAFLGRAVRFLLAQGVRQFIDLGSGIPTVGNVHEIVHAADPTAKVVYVDLDPVAVAHSRVILTDVANTAVVAGDLRKPADVLARPAVRQLLDFREPIAVLLVAVLHFVPDEDHPGHIVAGYAAACVPGSYVVISHAGMDAGREMSDREREALALYRRSPTPVILRSRDEVATLLGDLTLVEPGLVPAAAWRPDPAPNDPPAPLDDSAPDDSAPDDSAPDDSAPDDSAALGSVGVGRKD